MGSGVAVQAVSMPGQGGAGSGGQGRLSPSGPLRAYLHGETDVLAASTQCFLPEGVPWWLGGLYGVVGRAFGAFDMHREVEEVVGMWASFLPAEPLCLRVNESELH